MSSLGIQLLVPQASQIYQKFLRPPLMQPSMWMQPGLPVLPGQYAAPLDSRNHRMSRDRRCWASAVLLRSISACIATNSLKWTYDADVPCMLWQTCVTRKCQFWR